MNKIRVAVLANNSIGVPEFFWCTVEMQQAEIEEGLHYEVATARAEANGYESLAVFDEHDQAASELPELASYFGKVSTAKAEAVPG